MKGKHRLFRAMVTMGGSLALGCGGISARNEVDPGRGEGGTSGTQSSSGAGGVAGGAASTGSATGTGNSTSGGVTSSTGGTGGSIIVVGGTGGSAGTIAVGGTGAVLVEPGPFACPPEQWDCSANSPVCGGSARGWTLPDNCACDPTRPTTTDDCGVDEGLVCRKGTFDSQGRELTRVVPFECSCQPLITDCSLCEMVYPNYGDGLSCEQHLVDRKAGISESTLCGCAIVYLR